MKAVQVSRFGKPEEVVELIDLPDPGPPGPGEIVVDVEASAINPADLLMIEGRYGPEPPKLPLQPGGEGVGRIVAVGPDVSHLQVGDRILTMFALRGAWCQRFKARAARTFALPSADPLQLAMMSINPPTARGLLSDIVPLQSGDWVVQNAANSGVGACVIELARQRGLRTINIVRRPDIVASVEARGGDTVLVDGPDLAARIAALTGRKPPLLAIDALGGDATGRLAASVGKGGVVVSYGAMSNQPCRVDGRDIVFRNVSLRGFWLATWLATTPRDKVREIYLKLAHLAASGALRIEIEAVYPLHRIDEALAHAARPHRGGKILLSPPT